VAPALTATAPEPLPEPLLDAGARPTAPRLKVLLEAVTLGYYRGVMNALADIERHEPACAAWVEGLRPLARGFQFEALAEAITAQSQSSASASASALDPARPNTPP